MHKECEHYDFEESNTSHLKYNMFTGCRVLSAKILTSEKINEWLKTKFEISFLHMSLS